MEVHLPKPIHGWREFANEIVIIVMGVLIALGLEQGVDFLHWRHKVEQAEANMRLEAAHDRTNAAQYAVLAPCADAYVDRVRADLLAGDHSDLAKLYGLGEPFVTEAWTATAWDAAVASQIGDHMSADRFLAYAEAFRRANIMRDVQFRLRDHYAQALTGRYPLAADANAQANELTAAEYLRRDLVLSREIVRDFIANTDALGIGPDAARQDAYRAKARACLAGLAARP